MQKTLADMANYLIRLLPKKIPDDLALDTIFNDIAHTRSMREGVGAFRDFMYCVYKHLVLVGARYDKPKKEAHPFVDGTNIAPAYPFLCSIASILTNIGIHGELCENGQTITLANTDALIATNNISRAKLTASKTTDCLLFLIECGLQVEGIELGADKPCLPILTPIAFSYPKNAAMLIGLKVMAIAQCQLVTSSIQDILLRCDYRALANAEIDIFATLKDLILPLSDDVQETVIRLHEEYMSHGYKCTYYALRFFFRFTYYCRSKELWRLNISLNNGCTISIKSTNSNKYPDVVKKLPQQLQDKIAKGYGCGKKLGITDSCDGGCRGFRVAIDDNFVGIYDNVKAWIDAEMQYMFKK